MSIHHRLATALPAMVVLFPLLARADVVELTNGRKIEGLVTRETSHGVTLKLGGTVVVHFRRSRVRSISHDAWRQYVLKGDKADDPTVAIDFYRKAKKTNPAASGLDEKILQANQKIVEQKRLRARQVATARRGGKNSASASAHTSGSLLTPTASAPHLDDPDSPGHVLMKPLSTTARRAAGGDRSMLSGKTRSSPPRQLRVSRSVRPAAKRVLRPRVVVRRPISCGFG